MATSEVRFQDPGADAGYLLEALVEACDDAIRGGAIFAWTNAAGAKTLLGDEAFFRFAESGVFDLVVGVDSITDESAVEMLIGLATQLPNIRIRVFMHDQRPLFHPKLAWFASATRLTVIVGSGNLTMGGLKGNWEAFSVTHLDGDKASAVERRIADWLRQWEGNLVPVTDPRVLVRARSNSGSERSLKLVTAESVPDETVADEPVTDERESLLVAEIPMAGDRWSQANFDLANYEGFFGAKVGTQRRILLYNVSSESVLGEVETRPSVEVESQNYRFELAAARGLAYPTDGRPVGVFLRLATGQFLYMLLMPDSAHYPAVRDFLDRHWTGRSDRMRRVRTSVAELRRAWPGSPLWNVQLPEL